ncbi:MAG: metallophosphoesterase [Ramlibacter sp.]|nr:metallophosphoesterase [Ramlibacter sp.]
MRTLVHLSDLHFGRVDPALLAPLRECIARISPHLLVVSGDLTQRARAGQFEQAREFLDTLPQPQLVVPGNHDVPLYNVVKRFLNPLGNYRRHITGDLAPFFADDEIAVAGVNTARSLTFKDGRINREQLALLQERFRALDDWVTRIVVTHHPFDLPAGKDNDDLVWRAGLAMKAFAACGADLLLSGHMHQSHTGSTAARYPIEGYAALAIQAGTATSTRGRGEENSFNAIHVGGDEVRVDAWGWRAGAGRFSVLSRTAYERHERSWREKAVEEFTEDTHAA